MAKMLFDPPNFLVLDEPTNHLDMATKEMLVAALAEFEGTMLFVSHDRHFLAALSNRVLELTPEGVHQYGGGYTESRTDGPGSAGPSPGLRQPHVFPDRGPPGPPHCWERATARGVNSALKWRSSA